MPNPEFIACMFNMFWLKTSKNFYVTAAHLAVVCSLKP